MFVDEKVQDWKGYLFSGLYNFLWRINTTAWQRGISPRTAAKWSSWDMEESRRQGRPP